MQSLLILGRQPELGIAELESLYGSDKIQPVGFQAAIVDVDPCLLAFDRLGGSVKFCKVLTALESANWNEIEKFLISVSPGHSIQMPEGKMRLGLSLYGFNESLRRIESTGLNIKKAVRATGRNVRLVPNKEAALNTAQILHNQLTGPTGWELIFVRSGGKTVIAQTMKVQDIENYARRDQTRPKRDTKVGMLPPKLAQIIINLASGKLPASKLQNICDIPANQPIPPTILNQTVLDPFCGTGVVLQEALLMGYSACGTDLEPRMVEYSQDNLEWLNKNYQFTDLKFKLEAADATRHEWKTSFDTIAAETYLGRPLSSLPDEVTLQKIMNDCDTIHKKFLQNVAAQTESGFRLCVAIPAWRIKNSFLHLPTLDKLTDLGYNRIKFVHASSDQLIYHRPDQIVARELVVLERK